MKWSALKNRELPTYLTEERSNSRGFWCGGLGIPQASPIPWSEGVMSYVTTMTQFAGQLVTAAAIFLVQFITD